MVKKLTKCNFSDKKSFLIRIISNAGDEYGNKLVDFLTKYKLVGLKDATVEQLEQYITNDLHMQIGGKEC